MTRWYHLELVQVHAELSQTLFESYVPGRHLGHGLWMLLHDPLLIEKGCQP
jgi:hypothetical protein